MSPVTIPAHRPPHAHRGTAHGNFSRATSLRSNPSTFLGVAGREETMMNFDEDAAQPAPLGMLEDMERFAARLAHSFPTNPTGQVRLP